VTSRLPLSLLAAAFGAALMYLLLTLFGGAEHAPMEGYARIGVAGGLVVLLFGWLRIFRSRSLQLQPVRLRSGTDRRRHEAALRRVA
jgi:hypothetical protein